MHLYFFLNQNKLCVKPKTLKALTHLLLPRKIMAANSGDHIPF